MAKIKILNDSITKTFDNNDVSVGIIDGISITKTANKNIWINGPLEYILTIKNMTNGELTDILLTDEIDTLTVEFYYDYGVKIDGEKTENYSYDNGLLSVSLPLLSSNQTVEVVFQVLAKN